jgi:hypothetical protein
LVGSIKLIRLEAKVVFPIPTKFEVGSFEVVNDRAKTAISAAGLDWNRPKLLAINRLLKCSSLGVDKVCDAVAQSHLLPVENGTVLNAFVDRLMRGRHCPVHEWTVTHVEVAV